MSSMGIAPLTVTSLRNEKNSQLGISAARLDDDDGLKLYFCPFVCWLSLTLAAKLPLEQHILLPIKKRGEKAKTNIVQQF